MMPRLLLRAMKKVAGGGGLIEYSMIYNRRQTSYGTSRSYSDLELGAEAADREVILLIAYTKEGSAQDRFLSTVTIAGVSAIISDGMQFDGSTHSIGFARAVVPSGTTSQSLTIEFNGSVSVGAIILYRMTGRSAPGAAPTQAVYGLAGNISGVVDINHTIPAGGVSLGILGGSGWNRIMTSADPYALDYAPGTSGAYFAFSWDLIGEAELETDIQFVMSSYNAGYRYGIFAFAP